MTDRAELRQEYLAKAAQADGLAERSADAFYRDSWKTIADSYRQLAEQQHPLLHPDKETKSAEPQ